MPQRDPTPLAASPRTAPSPRDPGATSPRGAVDRLVDLVRGHPRLFVLTGAGVSTASGIPDYRDADGQWRRGRPVQYGRFVRDAAVRRRYWARASVGWRRFAAAEPGPAHRALASLESLGHVHRLVTQNVDGLHWRAGSRRVIELHGTLYLVDCLECRHRQSRFQVQRRLESSNAGPSSWGARTAPDGDADLEGIDLSGFRVPGCPRCGGVMKPAVVFFGESVPRATVHRAFAALEESDAVLVVGSSLMVWSGYRFCRRAVELGKPIAAVNLGRTRADDVITEKVSEDCDRVLPEVVRRLAG